MFLLFQPLSKQKLLPSKAQKLPEGGFQLCVGAQFPYATGDSKSLSAPNKGSVQWQVKLEIHVLCYCNSHKAQWKSPQETSVQYIQLFQLSPSTTLTETPN